ncbi:unnamed protein product [Symbiodinium necroappetens]|uniref:Uncharacterized protein n=1 Tax=Symbiodinium necroappetens TaxID=1628268 RepID=A0A812YS43_9DINO|nr:unnamed protein product [Symbiodinium necroappetens]
MRRARSSSLHPSASTARSQSKESRVTCGPSAVCYLLLGPALSRVADVAASCR